MLPALAFAFAPVAAASAGGAAEPASPSLQARIRQTAAGPMLLVNGKPIAPTILFVNLHDVADEVHTPLQLGEVAAAGRHGVNLVSLTIGTPWPREGEVPDFSARVDRWVELTLQANPNALLIPRIGVTWPPDWWYQAHPEERMLYDDGTRGIPSIHSEVWRRDAVKHLSALVGHLEAKYGAHILAYHPSGQHTGEWFFDRMWEGRISGLEAPARTGFRRYLRGKYGTDEALRRAWSDKDVTIETAEPPPLEERRRATRGFFRDPTAERRVVDFDEYRNLDMADVVALLCRAVKRAAPTKLSVAFYGYPFEVAPAPAGLQSSGHLGLHRLLHSPDVDVICSPVSYLDRGSGGGGYFMAPVDSVHLHGKLWLVEDDTRTHLSPPDAGYGRLSDWRETRGVLARNFGHIVTRGTAVWWMDLPGQGWFAGDEMWQYLGRLTETYQESLATRAPYRPEIAVIVDERSPLYGAPGAQVTAPLLYHFRTQWYRIGAPVGMYLLDDLIEGKVPPARFYILLNAFRLDRAEARTIRRRVGRRGCVALWIYAPGYLRGDQLSAQHIKEVTGIAVREAPARPPRLTDASGTVFDADHLPLSPTFVVDDPSAEVMARYAEGGDAALAARPVGSGLSVYSSVLQLPTRVLRDLARRAGVHLYNDQDDVVMAGSGWVALHATAAGTHALRLPRPARVRDVVSGEALGLAQTFRFDLARGDTKLLRVEAGVRQRRSPAAR